MSRSGEMASGGQSMGRTPEMSAGAQGVSDERRQEAQTGSGEMGRQDSSERSQPTQSSYDELKLLMKARKKWLKRERYRMNRIKRGKTASPSKEWIDRAGFR